MLCTTGCHNTTVRRFIPDDTDVDIFLFLKPGQTRASWREEVAPQLPAQYKIRCYALAGGVFS